MENDLVNRNTFVLLPLIIAIATMTIIIIICIEKNVINLFFINPYHFLLTPTSLYSLLALIMLFLGCSYFVNIFIHDCIYIILSAKILKVYILIYYV